MRRIRKSIQAARSSSNFSACVKCGRRLHGVRALAVAAGLVIIAGCSGNSGSGDPAADGGAAAGGAGQSESVPECPTYTKDFLPKVNAPVCAMCHEGAPRLPDWGVYSAAKMNCDAIASRVARGAMPPPTSGYTLTAAERTIVANWTGLGCPESTSDLPSSCP